MQIPVERADVDASFPNSEPTINGIAARIAAPLAVDLGIVRPEFTTRRRIHSVYAAEVAYRVHHAIDNDRSCLKAAPGSQMVLPRKAELRDVARVDITKRRVISAGAVSAWGEPLVRLIGRAHQSCRIKAACAWMRRRRRRRCGRAHCGRLAVTRAKTEH